LPYGIGVENVSAGNQQLAELAAAAFITSMDHVLKPQLALSIA